MALNEITKGMSNAAEQINANFLAGSVIESGTNADGSYVKFGDGTMITTTLITFGTGINATYALPASFVGAFGITLSSQNADAWSLQDLAIIGAGKASNNSVTLIINDKVPRKTNYAISLVITCIGRWK